MKKKMMTLYKRSGGNEVAGGAERGGEREFSYRGERGEYYYVKAKKLIYANTKKSTKWGIE